MKEEKYTWELFKNGDRILYESPHGESLHFIFTGSRFVCYTYLKHPDIQKEDYKPEKVRMFHRPYSELEKS